MIKLLSILIFVTVIMLNVGHSDTQQGTDATIESARQCFFSEKIIGSIYSGACMIPMGPSGKTFNLFHGVYNNMGGSAISDVKVEPFYSIKHFEEINTKKNLLLFNKTITRDGVHAIFLVLDILQIPRVKPTERLMWGDCKLNDVHDSEILVIAKQKDVKELRTIFKAWRANKQSGKFEPMSVLKVSCEQECVGDDCD